MKTYKIQPGDSLSSIADQFETNVETIVSINEGRFPTLSENPNLIQVGWELALPEVAAPVTHEPAVFSKGIENPPAVIPTTSPKPMNFLESLLANKALLAVAGLGLAAYLFSRKRR